MLFLSDKMLSCDKTCANIRALTDQVPQESKGTISLWSGDRRLQITVLAKLAVIYETRYVSVDIDFTDEIEVPVTGLINS
jgi:hypothetical protein